MTHHACPPPAHRPPAQRGCPAALTVKGKTPALLRWRDLTKGKVLPAFLCFPLPSPHPRDFHQMRKQRPREGK